LAGDLQHRTPIVMKSKELWYEYSNRYSTPQFTFLQVNVSNLPELAKRFKINVSGFTKQLPTVIILEDGEETVRFPPIQ
jgi:thioredoxin-like negative regulator of GroEL